LPPNLYRMPYRLLLTGANGLLGQKTTSLLIQNPDVDLIALGRGENRNPMKEGYTYVSADLTDASAMAEVFGTHQPDSVIHTAAQTQVDACEDAREACDRINVEAVETLCKLVKAHDSHLVHISTDFIFDGKNGPYSEGDAPNPVNYYGSSKLKAEQVVEKSGVPAAILRTILLYGVTPAMSRSNIVLWVKKSLESGKAINVVGDQWRNPTLAEDLAAASVSAATKKARGVYHISGPEFMSIIELARKVGDFWKLDTSLISEIDSASLNQWAKRPPRTGFVIDKAIADLDYTPHTLEQGLTLLDGQLKALGES